MKNKLIPKKFVSVLLAFCMILSLFTCAMMPVSAAANDEKMLSVNCSSQSACFFGYRSPSGGFAKGTAYRFSLDWENIEDAPFGDNLFRFYCYSGSWKVISSSSLTTEWSVSSYELEHGTHYDIDFTTSNPTEMREFVLYFGDINKNRPNMKFKTANWVLYTRDANDNLTDTGLMPDFDTVSFRDASDNAMNNYINSYTASDKGQIWRKYQNGYSSLASLIAIPSGYFAPVMPSFNGGDMNEDGTTDILDLVRFKKMMAGTIPVTIGLDCNDDGEENAADLSVMTQILLNAGVPGKLQNTYNKLRYGKSLNIGYIGGSVTSGTGASSGDTCYRALVTDYFEENFPLAAITENNMGLGGTGSYLGAARFGDNILKENPDLVFIEFAINDRYNNIPTEQTKQDIEYMIKELHNRNSYADVVIILITDRTVFGTEYPALLAIKSVAEYYGLPIVDVGAAMYEELGGSTANWNDYYFDSVHPLDAGHRVYADAITDKLDELLVNGGKTPHSLPTAPACANGFTTVNLLTRDSFESFRWGTLDSNIYDAHRWFDSDDYEIVGSPFRSSLSRCFSNILPKYIYPKYDGATLEFTVTGNSIGILGTLKEGQSLTVTLDGSETKTVSGSARSEMTEYPLWNSLSNTTHTVQIVAHGDGPYIAIAAVFVGS